MKLAKIVVAIGLFLILLFSYSCLEFENVNQPVSVGPDSTFLVTVKMSKQDNNECESEDGCKMYFGVSIPLGWAVRDSLDYYDKDGLFEGVLTRDPAKEDSLEDMAGRGGYYWWVGIASDTLANGGIFPVDTVFVELYMTSGPFTGDYLLQYYNECDPMDDSPEFSDYEPIRVPRIGERIRILVPDDFPTIQQAINASFSGDTVIVSPGTYIENINFSGKSIVVASHYLTTGDTSYISSTVIDGNRNGSVVTFENYEDSRTMLCGFTIRNGSGNPFGDNESNQHHGGGIFLTNYADPHLKNLLVTENVAYRANGAGICCWYRNDCLIEDVIVTRNDGSGEAGQTNDGSGGILIAGRSNPILRNVEITNNTGIMAGGLYCNSATPALVNVTIANNYAVGSSEYSSVGELVAWSGSHPILVNTIIRNDELTEILVRDDAVTYAYSDIKIISGTAYSFYGNIISDPLFVDPSKNNFQLQTDSPCIDAGIAFFVYKGDTLINLNPDEYIGTAPDMGAYEFDPAVAVNDENILPEKFQLLQNYPNPFNPTTTIKYSIPADSRQSSVGSKNSKENESPLPRRGFRGGLINVQLKIYNVLGKEVATLVNTEQHPGNYEVKWDASGQTSGVYFYNLTSGDFRETKKMVLLR